jgi:hypothetical protein
LLLPIAFDAFTDSPPLPFFVAAFHYFVLHFSDTPPPPPLPPLFAAADFRHRMFTLFASISIFAATPLLPAPLPRRQMLFA